MTDTKVTSRVRTLEISAAARGQEIETLKTDLQQLEHDHRQAVRETEARLLAIEKSLVRLAVPMKAVTWAAALLATSLLALVWSLILGEAHLVFP